jgi:outer membrane receptor protein involved in Fe transport
MRMFRGVLFGAAAFILSTAVAFAQATAELNGRVTDESGAVLPGVTVTATQTETGFVRSAVTDGNGAYVMPNLPTGPYRLEVMLQGFRTYVQTGIVLQVAATPTINAVLAVGSLEETVSVEAAAPLVDVRSAGISEVVEQERILELPLQGRNVTDLIVLAGAAVQSGTNTGKSMPGSTFTAVAGGQPFGVAYLLDGAAHNNPYDNANMPLPFPDALQEFRVATSGLSADNGMHAGGSVNAVTKSGTNAFHGALFEFVRDKRLNATSVFAPQGPDGKKVNDGLKRHQLGGTLGGPIIADKFFFFGAYQGTFVRTTPADSLTKTLTADMLAGDFTAFTSPACNSGRQVTLRAPFVNNRVNPALYSPVAMNISKRVPISADPCGDIRYSAPQHYDQGQIISKIDYQVNANHSLFGRYIDTFDEKLPSWPESNTVFTTGTDDAYQEHRGQSLTVGDTMVFGASMVNSFRMAWNRSHAAYHLEPFFGAEEMGVKGFHNYVPGIMALAISGAFTTAAGGSVLFVGDTDAYQLSDDVTMVRGSHQLALGTNVAYWIHDTIDGQRGVGLWTFDGSVTGTGLSDFLAGRMSQLEHARPGELHINQLYLGLYAQDTWRVNSRVTVNGGLRWEPFFGQNVRNNAISNFNLENFRNGVKTTVYSNAPAGLVYPGDPGFPSGKSGLNKQWGNVSPRIGLAWDVTGDGRTAFRTSYGRGYEFMSAGYLFISATAPPFSSRLRVTTPAGGLDDPYRDYPGGPPHPYPAQPGKDAPFPEYAAFGSIDPDINSTRTQSWNVIVERQIGPVWQASAAYLGSYTDRLWGQVQVNPGVFLGLGPCTINGVVYATCSTNTNLNQRRVLSLENPQAARQLGPIDRHAAVGTQDYHAMRLSVQRRSASGVRLSANYTRSYCVGNTVTTSFGQVGSGFLKPEDPAFDRGNCTQDRRHIGNVTAGIRTPDFTNPALRVLAADWTVSGILNARSGSYLTVTTARDVALIGISAQRVNQLTDDVYGDGTLNNYLNPAAFAYPAAGELGNHVRGSVTGPAYWTIDMALARDIPLGGAKSVELRVETFNLLNHFNWGNPQVNFDSGAFGRIQSQSGSPRILQFGIKYGF